MARPKRPGTSTTRTDLLSPRPQPVTTPTGLPYGEAGQLAQAQSAVPVPNAPQATGGPQPPAAQPGGMDESAVLGAATAMAPHPPIHRPTERPGEPITAGMGPGGSPLAVASDPSANIIQGLYARFGFEGLRQLMSVAQANQQQNGAG